MKVNFDYKKAWAIIRQNLHAIVLVAILFGVTALGYGSYLILVPQLDTAIAKTENVQINKYNITFDKRALDEIKNKKSPSIISENGGRNPFLPF